MKQLILGLRLFCNIFTLKWNWLFLGLSNFSHLSYTTYQRDNTSRFQYTTFESTHFKPSSTDGSNLPQNIIICS